MRCSAVIAGLVAVLVAGAGNSVAGPSAVTPFELVVAGAHELVPQSPAFPFGIRHYGTFTASTPFCASGTFFDLTNDLLNSTEDSRLYVCADGSGTLTTQQEDWFEHKPPYTSTWRILAGTGRYTDLRGRGTYVGECSCGIDDEPLTITYRSVYRGLLDFDAVAPTVSISNTRITKLRSPAGAYVLRFALVMRDNGSANRISYSVAVEPAGGGLYVVEKKGSTAPGTVRMTLKFQLAGARAVLLHLGGEDPVGNTRWTTRRLKLPR